MAINNELLIKQNYILGILSLCIFFSCIHVYFLIPCLNIDTRYSLHRMTFRIWFRRRCTREISFMLLLAQAINCLVFVDCILHDDRFCEHVLCCRRRRNVICNSDIYKRLECKLWVFSAMSCILKS